MHRISSSRLAVATLASSLILACAVSASAQMARSSLPLAPDDNGNLLTLIRGGGGGGDRGGDRGSSADRGGRDIPDRSGASRSERGRETDRASSRSRDPQDARAEERGRNSRLRKLRDRDSGGGFDDDCPTYNVTASKRSRCP